MIYNAAIETGLLRGPSLDDLRAFPKAVRREVGYQLDRVQHGLEPNDWKPIKRVGPGACEIRVQHDGQYRVAYIAKLPGAVARRRLKEIREMRRWRG